MSRASTTTNNTSTKKKEPTQKAGSDPAPDPRDAILSRYKEYHFSSVPSRHQETMDHSMRVGNLPADKTVTWALDPRLDGGGHLGMIQDLGFRPAYVDEVSTNPYIDDKMIVPSYLEHPNGFVQVGDRILMVGYRQYRDQRRQANADRSRAAVENASDAQSNLGVEIESDQTVSGPLGDE